MQIYILEGQEQRGPFTVDELKQKIILGECSAETLGWYEELASWQPLKVLFPDMFGANPSLQPSANLELQPVANTSEPAAITGEKAWYDYALVFVPAMLICFPFGLIPLWMTKRFDTKTKVGLSAAIPLGYALYFIGFAGLLGSLVSQLPVSPSSSRTTTLYNPIDQPSANRGGAGKSADAAIQSLGGIGRSAFGPDWFKAVEDHSEAGGPLQLVVKIEPPFLESKKICRELIKFFTAADKAGTLSDIEILSFRFYNTLIFDDGNKEEMEVLRLTVNRDFLTSTKWENYDPLIHADLFKNHLLRSATDSFFISKIDWDETGWR